MIKIFTDGGSRGNPGPSALGVVIGDKHFKKFLGSLTNNQAEYEAVVFALEKAKELGFQELEINLDSELVFKQLIGEYKVKHLNMKPLYEKAIGLVDGFESVSFNHVLREKNKVADKLVNEALDVDTEESH
jgi:ribonuclease HI